MVEHILIPFILTIFLCMKQRILERSGCLGVFLIKVTSLNMSISGKQEQACFGIHILRVKDLSWFQLVCCCTNLFGITSALIWARANPNLHQLAFLPFHFLGSHWELLQSEKDIFYINCSTSIQNQWKIYRFQDCCSTLVSCKHGNW